MTLVAGVLVTASGIWLVGLGVTSFLAPEKATRLLESFASSARAHYTEQLLRLAGGLSLLLFASEMRAGTAFELLGWFVSVTSVLLILLPWTWHRHFAEWSIPLATRNLRLFGAGSAALGTVILFAAYL